MSDPSRWFAGSLPPADPLRECVVALRETARRWNFDDLSPENTSTYALGVGWLVEVEVPGLTCETRYLRAWFGVDEVGRIRRDYELGADYILDGLTTSPETFAGSATESGQQAAAWLESQLRRPIVRHEWDRPHGFFWSLIPTLEGDLIAREWRYDDDDDDEGDRWIELEARFWWWRRLTQEPSSRQIQERPDRRVER